MAHEKIVTAFNQLQQAEAAKEKLIAEGIAENHIDIISGVFFLIFAVFLWVDAVHLFG